MNWHGRLTLDYSLDDDRTIALDRHDGPLRVLQRLYPEGPQVCHHVLVHPPGGIVGGDTLDVVVTLQAGTHALVTTPGATRFYRSAGETATQTLTAHVAPGARLEWLPLETIAYRGCLAQNRLHFELASGAEMIGWDVLALGLPAAGEPFDMAHAGQRGQFTQHIVMPGVWQEKGTIDAADSALLDSPLGLAGHRVMGTLWFASGSPLSGQRAQGLLDLARTHITDKQMLAGATSTHEQVVVVRALADRVEPLMQLFSAIWASWREAAWQRPACQPRVWRT